MLSDTELFMCYIFCLVFEFYGKSCSFFVCFFFLSNWWSIMCILSIIIDTKRQVECLHEWAWRWGETAWLTTHAVNQTYVCIYSQKVCSKVVSFIVCSGASRHQKINKSTIWGEENKIQVTLISLRRLREKETVPKQGHLPVRLGAKWREIIRNLENC